MVVHSAFLAAAIGLLVVTMMDPSRVMLCSSFSPMPLPQTISITTKTLTSTALSMGKGLNKFKNKQADLKRKLELAKQQQKDGSPGMEENAEDETPKAALTAEQIKERNDRKRFEQLLQREGAKSLNAYNSDGYLNRNQEEEEITAARKCYVVVWFGI